MRSKAKLSSRNGHDKPTERKQLVDARLGQGTFVGALRASHIKPRKPSSDTERLDGQNRGLLMPDFDALFDEGLISFADDGEMLIADRISTSAEMVADCSDCPPASRASLPKPEWLHCGLS